MLLERILKGEIETHKSDSFIFNLVATAVLWMIFRYNWVFNIPVFFAVMYLDMMLYDRVRVYRYIASGVASFFWGVGGLVVGLIVYYILKAGHFDPGVYFIILLSLSCFCLSLFMRYKQFKKDQLQAVDDNMQAIKSLKSNTLGMVTITVSGFFYLLFLAVCIYWIEEIPKVIEAFYY